MNIIINLLATVAVAAAVPTVPNDELGRALVSLHGKVVVADRSRGQQLYDAGAWLSVHAIYLAGIVAIGSIVPPKVADAQRAVPPTEAQRAAAAAVAEGQRILLRGAVIAVNVGGIMWLIGWIGRKLSPRPRPAPLVTYETPEGVAEFFTLSLEDQYAVASRDAHFTRFVLELARAHELIAHPDPARTPAAL